MLMVCHHLNPAVPEDLAFAESRIRPSTIAAEDVLHDLGAISMIGSDSQAMGRVGEVVLRTWQTAHVMKGAAGRCPATGAADNLRARRYVAKYTICPAVAHGLDGEVGSVEVGKLADLVLWEPAFFGVRPHLVVKGGVIAWAAMGDANASIPTPQPVLPRPMFGAAPAAAAATSVHFVAPAAHRGRAGRPAGLRARWSRSPTRGRRQGRPAAQRRAAAHRGRPRTRSRCASTASWSSRAPADRAAHGPALLPVLMVMTMATLLLADAAAPGRRPRALRAGRGGGRGGRVVDAGRRWRRSCAAGWPPRGLVRGAFGGRRDAAPRADRHRRAATSPTRAPGRRARAASRARGGRAARRRRRPAACGAELDGRALRAAAAPPGGARRGGGGRRRPAGDEPRAVGRCYGHDDRSAAAAVRLLGARPLRGERAGRAASVRPRAVATATAAEAVDDPARPPAGRCWTSRPRTTRPGRCVSLRPERPQSHAAGHPHPPTTRPRAIRALARRRHGGRCGSASAARSAPARPRWSPRCARRSPRRAVGWRW